MITNMFPHSNWNKLLVYGTITFLLFEHWRIRLCDMNKRLFSSEKVAKTILVSKIVYTKFNLKGFSDCHLLYSFQTTH